MSLTRRHLLKTAPAALAISGAGVSTLAAASPPVRHPLIEAGAALDRILAEVEALEAKTAVLWSERPPELDIAWPLAAAGLKGAVGMYLGRRISAATEADLCQLPGRWCADQAKRWEGVTFDETEIGAIDERITALLNQADNLEAYIIGATPTTPDEVAVQARVALRGVRVALAAGDPEGAAGIADGAMARLAALAAGVTS